MKTRQTVSSTFFTLEMQMVDSCLNPPYYRQNVLV